MRLIRDLFWTCLAMAAVLLVIYVATAAERPGSGALGVPMIQSGAPYPGANGAIGTALVGTGQPGGATVVNR